ncbi:MAG: hypothetical protein J7494_03680 [Sphingobium sp.]|nr:hypothetical protein [Sphingobium sp.]
MTIRAKHGVPALLFLTLLAACKYEPKANQVALSNESNVTEIPADEGAAANAGVSQAMGTLIPPAPGEPGGLPDDRTPLNEQAARNPTSIAASGATVERFGLALSDGRYGEAYRLWRGDGRQSGMSADQFADAYRKYAEIHVLVGRPEAGGTETARVPVQMYGRLRDGGQPFNLYGMMTLARNPKGQNGEPGQQPWLIASSELKPQGEVKVGSENAAASTNVIPAGFLGHWSETQAGCSKKGDMSRLIVYADTLVFYESQGKVTAVHALGPGEISIDARYDGEGETWSRSSRLRLADNALVLDGMRRVRCLA